MSLAIVFSMVCVTSSGWCESADTWQAHEKVIRLDLAKAAVALASKREWPKHIVDAATLSYGPTVTLNGVRGLVVNLDAGRAASLSIARFFALSKTAKPAQVFEKESGSLLHLRNGGRFAGRDFLLLAQAEQCAEELSTTWLLAVRRGAVAEVGSYYHEALPCGGGGAAATADLQVEKGEAYLVQKIFKNYGVSDEEPRGNVCAEQVLRRLIWDDAVGRMILGEPKALGGNCPPEARLQYEGRNFSSFELPAKVAP